MINQGPSFPREVPFPGPDPARPESTHAQGFTIPVVYDDSETEQMSLRAYSAIQLRVPESGIEWLDRMIERSRELDRKNSTEQISEPDNP